MTGCTGWGNLCRSLTDTTVGTIGTLLQTTVGLAGLLLVFVGFAYARGEAFHDENRRDIYRNVVRGGFAFPFLASLLCAWVCLSYLQGNPAAYSAAFVTFKAALIITALYAFVVVFVYL